MNIKAFGKNVGYALLCATLLTACSQGQAQGGASPSTAASAATATSGASAETASLDYANEIDKTKIMTFSIDADETQWQEMLDNATAEEYISADVTINGITIKNVGIRPKGNSSLSQVARDDTSDRYSFKIKFDEYVDGQTWMGLDKIVVNNIQSDNSYMKEYLSYDIMSYIGVDAPLYAFADISVNGEAWGFYLAVEVIDGSYLDRTKDGQGELYKPNNDDNGMMGGMENPPEGGADFEGDPGRMGGGMGGGGMDGSQNGVSLVYTDDQTSSYSAIFDNAETKTTEEDYQRVITALQNLNNGTDLEEYVDVDAVLKYFAAHNFVVNMDSYTSNMGHNYYLYENDGQLSMLPWDYNLSFGGFQAGTASEVVNLAIDTPLSGVSLDERPILGKLLEVPEYMEKYHSYLQQIVDGYFADGQFTQTVSQLDQLIGDHVKNDPSATATYEEYQQAVAELTKLGELRAESVQGQLKGTIPSMTEAQEADSGALIDASSVDLTKLGTQGRGGQDGQGGQGGFGGRGGDFPNGRDQGTRPQ